MNFRAWDCHLLVSWHSSIVPIPPLDMLDPAVNFRKFPKKWRQQQVLCRKLQRSPWLLPELKRRVHRYRSWAEKIGINSAARNAPKKAGKFRKLDIPKETSRRPLRCGKFFWERMKGRNQMHSAGAREWQFIQDVKLERFSGGTFNIPSIYACICSWQG